MNSGIGADLELAIDGLASRFPGPGGAVAVVKNGTAILRHTWGYANLERRIPYTASTIAPLCSITKQFTCAALLSACSDPSELDDAILAQVPRLAGERPTTLELANNQSGLRDYWAMTVLCGAMPEGDFRPADAKTLLEMNSSLHFPPGTAYSYSNGNFRILSNAIEQKVGQPFANYMMQQAVAPTGMQSAIFAPETSALPGGASGYEGTLATGWRPAINRIHWSGDAGLCASLEDMIAWECFIDRTRHDPAGIYARLSRPATFRDGSPASYGLGLARRHLWGRDITGHGGAIRGWRMQRYHVAADRLSVVVAFNHESDARGDGVHLLAAALGESDALPPSQGALAHDFIGIWLDAQNGLLLDVKTSDAGMLSATYDGGTESLSVGADGVARGHSMTLTRDGGAIHIDRPADAIHSIATPVGKHAANDISGTYRSSEFESELEIETAGGCCFAGFKGFLGQGPMMPLIPVGDDVWLMACKRSLDAPAPGDWTVRVQRSAGGKATALTIGCWLARNVRFQRC